MNVPLLLTLTSTYQLFVKPTEGGKAYIGDVVEAEPYPGAKLYFLIEDKFEDRERIGELITMTAQELPMPRLKRSRAKGD